MNANGGLSLYMVVAFFGFSCADTDGVPDEHTSMAQSAASQGDTAGGIDDTADMCAAGELVVSGYPLTDRICVDVAKPEEFVACATDPRANGVFPQYGAHAVAFCAKRSSDGAIFTVTLPPSVYVGSSGFEDCSNLEQETVFSASACDFTQCTGDTTLDLVIACSVADFCEDTGVECGATVFDDAGCVRPACKSDADCEGGSTCGEPTSTPSRLNFAYTPEGRCLGAGLGDGPLVKRCVPN